MTKPAESNLETVLLLDTTGREQTNIAVITKNSVKLSQLPVRAQELQKMIDELLKKSRLKITDISAVAVLTGPGSYTGTRMGVAAANTLNWLLNLPILEIPGDSFDQAIELVQNKKIKTVTQATARY